MTTKQTEEGNKEIAFFMGAKEIEPIGHTKRNIEFPIVLHGLHIYNERDLQYHSSWEWLMEVVRKISTLKYDDNDGTDEIYNYPYLRTFQNYPKVMVRINRCQLFEADTLIEATWLAVVDFIKYYNTLHPEDKCKHDWIYVGTVNAEYCNKCKSFRDIG